MAQFDVQLSRVVRDLLTGSVRVEADTREAALAKVQEMIAAGKDLDLQFASSLDSDAIEIEEVLEAEDTIQ